MDQQNTDFFNCRASWRLSTVQSKLNERPYVPYIAYGVCEAVAADDRDDV